MNDLKSKPFYRVCSALLAIMLLVSLMPATVWAGPESSEPNAIVSKSDEPSSDTSSEPVTELVNVKVNQIGQGQILLNGEADSQITVEKDSQISVKVIPDTDNGYAIKTITIDGQKTEFTVSNGNSPYELTDMKVSGNTTIRVEFVKCTTVTVQKYEGGEVTLNDKKMQNEKMVVFEGTELNLGVKANDNYQISSITVGEESKDISDINNFSKKIKITSDTAIAVKFDKVYRVTLKYDSEKGTITPEANTDGGIVKVKTTDGIKITATPKENYRVSQVSINGKKTEFAGNQYTKEKPYVSAALSKKDQTVEVVFAPMVFSVKINRPNNGTATVDNASVDYGKDATVTIMPKDGYAVDSVVVNNKEINLESNLTISDDNKAFLLKLESITEDKTVTVSFAKSEILTPENITVSISEDSIIKTDPKNNQYVLDKDTIVKISSNTSGLFGAKGIEVTYSDGTKDKGANGTVTIDKSLKITKIRVLKGLGWSDIKSEGEFFTLDIVIDKESPEVTFTPPDVSGNDAGFFNSDVSVAIEAVDPAVASDLKSVVYWIENGDVKSGEKTLYTHEEEAADGFNGTITVSASDYQGDNVQVHVKATDRAGNEREETCILHINSTAPTMDFAFTDSKPEDALKGYYNATRSGEITITDRADCFASDNVKLLLKKGNKAMSAPVITWTVKGGKYSGTFELTDEGRYSDLSISYTNRAGLAAGTLTSPDFVIDKTAPTGEISVDSKAKWNALITPGEFAFNTFRKNTVTVSANATDKLSGVQFVKYYKADSEEALNGETLEELFKNGEFTDTEYTFDAEEKFTVYARITDKAGNTKYISTNGVIIDMTQSVISFQIEREANAKGIYNRNCTVSVSVKDNVNSIYSGIKSVKYYVVNNYKESKPLNTQKITQSGSFEVTDPEMVSGEVEINASKNVSTDVRLIVVAEDNAGNQSVAVTDKYAFNPNKPIVSVSSDDDETDNHPTDYTGEHYYKAKRTLILTYADQDWTFSQEKAENGIVITAENMADGSTINKSDMISWEYDNSTPNIHVAKILFSEDAKYTVSVSYTNDADLSLDPSNTPSIETFTVDTTAPSGELVIKGRVKDAETGWNKTWNESTWETTWKSILSFLTFGYYSHDKVTVNATATDATSPTFIEYCKQNKAVSVKSTDNVDNVLSKLKFTSFNGRIEVNPNEQFVIYLRIRDAAGNVTYITQDSGVVVDDRICEITLPDDLTGIYNHDVDVNVKVKDDTNTDHVFSGIRQISYQVFSDSTETQSYTYSFDQDADRKSKYDFTISVDSTLNNSSDVVVKVRAIDNAGNVSEKSMKLDIDVTAPEISVKYKDTHNKDAYEGYFTSRTATVTIKERANHFDADDATAGISVTGKNYKGDTVSPEFTISDWSTTANTENPDEATYTATVTFLGDANYDFTVNYTDKAGNAADQYQDHFTVDTVAPTGTITATTQEERKIKSETKAESLVFAFWSKVSMAFSQTSEDVTSPIDSVKYYVDYFVESDTPAVLSDDALGKVDWHEFNPFSIEAARDGNKQFVVYLKVTDYAGNTTYISTNGLIVDDEMPEFETVSPEISVKPKSAKPINGIYKSDIVFEVTVKDPIKDGVHSGLNKVWYEVYDFGSGKKAPTQSDPSLFVFGSDYSQEKIAQFSIFKKDITVSSQKNNSNDVRLIVHAIDNAGNESEQTTSIKIDTTAPEMYVTYDNNNVDSGKYFKADRTATIVVRERNFDPNQAIITITNPHGFIPTHSNWVMSKQGTGNCDDREYRTTIVYNKDGDYKFSMNCTDLASNFTAGDKVHYSGVVPTEFTIDKTIPTVNVTYNNRDSRNGKYYNKARTATITINEHNFSTDRILVKMTAKDRGEGKAVPAVSKWSNNGDKHIATISFSKDAEYTFDIDYTDLAGNKAADYKPDDFVVDQTAPTIDITGVADKHSYNGNVSPVIILKDTNFNKNAVGVQLNGVNNGKVNYNRGVQNVAYGQSIGYSNFTRSQDVDDIYILTINLTDMAGNQTKKTISFSVNRFGSTYDLTNIEEVIGKYLQTEEDIVFTETNVDSLKTGSVKLQLVKNGTPSELVEEQDYTIEKSGGNGKWSQYQYTINKELFAEDGNYSLSIYSVDAAGNVNENIDEAKEAEMRFGIDKTKPVIVVSNLESNTQYAEPEKEVQMEIKDNLELKGVRILLDNREVKYAQSGNSFTFKIPQSNSLRNLEVIAVDSANNETKVAIDKFLVTTNIFARWYNNTPLFIGSIAGLAILIIAVIAFLLFGRRRRNDD